MKMYLFIKHTLRENYKYFLTVLVIYGFMGILYHTAEYIHPFMQIVTTLFTMANAVVLPHILYKNYYHQTNTNHMASIPMTRLEIFISQYFLGLVYGVGLNILSSCATELMVGSTTSWINYSSLLLVMFVYYYHLSLLAFWICGHIYFNFIVLIVLVLGPIVAFLLYHYLIVAYDSTYLLLWEPSTMMKLLPALSILSIIGEESMNMEVFYGQFLIQSVINFVLTIIAVRYRPNERTGQSMMYNLLSYVMRSVIVLLGAATMFGICSIIVGRKEYVSQFIACIIVSMMAAYLVEMIYKKKVKVFYSLKYGILAAVVIFASFFAGIRAIENYIPFNYDSVSVDVTSYVNFWTGQDLKIKDSEMTQKVEMFNRKLMDHYQIYGKSYDELYGYITIKYFDEDGQPFFGREYKVDEKLQSEILKDSELKKIYLQGALSQEQWILDQVKNKQPLTFVVYTDSESIEYSLETDQQYYLFENYLKQAMEEVYQSSGDILKLYDNDDYLWIRYKVDDNFDEVSTSSVVIQKALSKTFNF